jgi:hypothetical protein
MENIKKPEDIGAKLQTISSKVNAETLPKIASAYNVGKARDFSAKQANLAKYATYGSETFGKLGFDPFKASHTSGKSGMDELYDENTSWTADIGRAYTGMKKLAGIGIQDTFGLGAFADSGNYLSFEDTMNKYSSSRGGNTGFWSNTMLSSGYTMGIIGGIAAEELALAGITVLSGGTAAPATIAAGGTALARAVGKIKGGMSMLQSVNKLQDLNTAKGFLGSTGKFVGGSLKSFGKALNPLENTYDFLKTIDKLEDFNGWKQTAIGAGAVVRDARKITMAHSESKLEADLASKEFRQKMYDEYYTDKSKIGTEIPESQLKLIDDEANKVKDRVYAANFGLIYVTNAITFDNMFKNMKGTNRWAAVANAAYRISKKEGGKVTVDALAKTFGNAIRKKVGSITLGGSIKSAISSSMEGFQELGQDAISESMKSYHARNVKGTQVRGGFMEYLHNDLATAADKLKSGEGLSTFLSGALMGVFASPVGFATGQVNNFLANGGAQKTYQRTFDNKKWKAEKLSLEVKRKEKARVLTEFFNNNKNFIDGFSKPIYSQNELQEQILQAAEDKNQKGFKNAQHDSFVTGVHTLLEAGLENEFANHLEYMSKNFGAKELNEVFGRTDITEENKARYQAKLQTQATNVKQLREKYNEIQNNIVNPNSMKGAKVTDSDYLEKYIKWRSVENLKKELLFSDSKIVDRANRIEVLKKEINDDTPLSSLEVNSLLDESTLEQQIELLEIEVKSNDGLTLTGKGSENLEKAKLKLEAFKVYQEKLKAYTSENKKEDGTVYESDAYDDLFEAYNGLMQAFGKNTLTDKTAQTEKNKKQFDKVFDYISLGEENKYYQEFVDTLLNPAGASAYLKGQEDMLKRLDESKEDHIANALKAFEEKSTADDMLNALYNEGLFFDLNELDDLIKNRMMPSEIFNIEDNNKSASPEQTKVAQEIIEKFIKRLTGKSIINDKTTLNKQGRKLKSDKRTLAGIMRQYNIKLGQEVNLSSKAGQRLLEKMMAKENKFLTRLDREILAKLGEQDATIKFVTDGTLPVQMNEDGVIVLDLRFAGRDFKNSVMSVENLIVTGLTQNKIANQLKTKDDLWLAARNAMEQAKEQFKKSFPSQNIDEVEVFTDPVLFLTEAMNDIQFQKFLGQIEDNIQPASKSLWDTLMTGVEEIVNEDFDKKLANRVINISAKALDDSIVDNIAEENTEVKEVKEEKAKAKTEKFDELTTLAKELGLRWNVNVKIVANKEEAEKILGGIENPFFESEGDGPSGFYDEKTNTAYIVADSVKPGTVYHEVFLHPFLINLEKTNPEFYKKLVDEAKSDQEAIDYVNKNYGTAADLGVRQYEHEIVGRVYNKSINNQLDKTKNPGLFKIIGQFIKKMLTSVGDYFGINKTDIKRFNEKKTTIADLAKYSVTGTAKVDLGKVLEAEDIIQGTAAKTPKTRKVQRQRVITKEEAVNAGGNVVVLNNAADRPDIFDEFLHPEIVFGNNLAIAEWTEKLVELGQELDDARITNWAYGNIRAQVGGRLIIDVTAEIPVFVKKALQNKKANPRVTELQKEIAGLDTKIQQLIAQRKITTGSPSVVSAGTEAKRKEILDKWNSKRAWYQKEDRLSEWYKERDKELAALDTNVEAQKAEIERRRQEEIGTKERRSYTDEKGVTTTVTITEEKDRKIARVEVTKGSESAGVYTETYSKDLPNDTIYEQHNADELDYTPVEKLKVEGKRVEKINAKYNAEIADLREIANVLKQRNALQDQLDEEDENIIEEGEETVQQGTKKVKFLMYKSTGTGSTAASLGEWVPLIAIGTNPDGSEWFVKAFHKGQDPKFNKYGSVTFADIDRDLKVQEANLFTEPENWVTQEVEETITEEVEEEVTEEEVFPTAEEAARTQASYVNEAESIKNKINQTQNQLDKYNQELADNKLTFVQKRTARRKVTELSIELNELYQRLNDIQPKLDAFKADGTFEDPELEYAPRYDYNGNEVITHETPWPSVPKDLREAIALLYGKPLSKITQEDVISIREEMKTNPVYIGLVSDFTENRLQEQNAQLGEKELEENRKKTEAAKEARRQQLLDEQEESKTAKKQRRQLQTPITDEEFLKNILKDLDFSILTSKEMSMLIDKFKNRTAANPYGVNDIIAYISNKTAEEEKKKLRRKLLDDNKKMQAQKKIDKQITENLKALRTNRLSYSDAKNKTINLRITNEMVRFIATYHSDIFAQDSASFAQSVDAILQKRKSELAKLKSQPISFKPKAVHLQLMTLIKKLEKNKTLYPETVYQINLALYKLNSDLRVKMIRQGKAAPLSTMYEIGKKSKSENRTPFGKTPTKYSEKKKAILNFDLAESTFADEKNTEIAILQKLIQGEKVEKDEADSVLLKYKNLANAVDKVSSDIANAVPVNEMDSDIDLSEEEQQALLNLEEQGMTKEEAEAELSNLKFMSSPEGQELLDKEAEALSQYYDSVQAEIVNGEFEGDENDLSDEDIDLLNSTEEEEAVEPEADNAELANDLANAEIEIPFNNEEVDLNENPKSLTSEIEMLHTELINNKPFYVTNYSYAGELFDNLNKGKFGDLVYAIAAYRYMNVASYNPGQLKALNVILLDKFRTGVFTDKSVNIDGKAYRVAGFQENKITLQDLELLEEKTIELAEFMNNVIEVLKPGAEFNSVNIDTVVNVAEFDYIKDAYDEILNNFASFMGEANSLSEEDLMADLNKEITKCK